MSAKPNIQSDKLPLYAAFISYSHKDEKVAARLHRRLERYKIPKSLRRGKSDIGIVFRDKVELSASAGLSSSIHAALEASEALIVLCSPDTAVSHWVNEEVTYFKSLGRGDRIFTVILSGEPFAQERGFKESDECLPEALRFKVDANGNLKKDRSEPLAADFRPGGDGERLGTLKIVSAVLGVRLDALLQRQLVRARKRMIGLAVAASTIVAVLTGLTWTAYSAQQKAEARRADAENFVEFLLSDLSHQLEGYGRLDLLDAVGEKAIDYYTQFDEVDFDAEVNGRRARTLHFMGNLQNALGETQVSENYIDQSYIITEAGLAADPNNPKRIFEHARSAYMRSLPFRNRLDYAGELKYLAEYAALCEKLYDIESGSVRSILQYALATTYIGRVKLRTRDVDQANAYFNTADDLYNSLDAESLDVDSLLSYAENMAWQSESYRDVNDYQASYDTRLSQVKLLKEKQALSPDDFRITEGLIYAKLGLGAAAMHLARYNEAVAGLSGALADTEKALRLEPDREKMRRAKSAILYSLMTIAVNQKDAQNYAMRREQLIRLQAQPVAASVRENKYWNEVLPKVIADLDEVFKGENALK